MIRKLALNGGIFALALVMAMVNTAPIHGQPIGGYGLKYSAPAYPAHGPYYKGYFAVLFPPVPNPAPAYANADMPVVDIRSRIGNLFPPAMDTVSVLVIQLPENADLWIDGVKTSEKGGLRQFVSSPFEAGSSYKLEVRAEWLEDGRKVSQTEFLSARPGIESSVTFLARPGVQKASRSPADGLGK